MKFLPLGLGKIACRRNDVNGVALDAQD